MILCALQRHIRMLAILLKFPTIWMVGMSYIFAVKNFKEQSLKILEEIHMTTGIEILKLVLDIKREHT